MGAAIPQLGALLNMSVDRLPGDRFDMPRIQAPTFGSSLRMAVSPGREKEGYLIMACGESGNPLSPHYRDCHKARVTNARTPFLPGASTRRLLCHPCPQRSALRTLCFPTDRSRHRSLQRSHRTTSRVLLAQSLPGQTTHGAFLRQRSERILRHLMVITVGHRLPMGTVEGLRDSTILRHYGLLGHPYSCVWVFSA